MEQALVGMFGGFSACTERGLGAVRTPDIDRIAAEGMLLVSDYFAQPRCNAGRAAFLTGQYPIRTGLTCVGQPGSPIGLQAEDVTIAKLLKSIDDLGIAGNTIMLLTSDSGVNLPHWPSAGTASFRGKKGTTWDGGFRVPMRVRWPGRVPAGQWAGGLMSAKDWPPTLLAATEDTTVKQDLLRGVRWGAKPSGFTWPSRANGSRLPRSCPAAC